MLTVALHRKWCWWTSDDSSHINPQNSFTINTRYTSRTIVFPGLLHQNQNRTMTRRKHSKYRFLKGEFTASDEERERDIEKDVGEREVRASKRKRAGESSAYDLSSAMVTTYMSHRRTRSLGHRLGVVQTYQRSSSSCLPSPSV